MRKLLVLGLCIVLGTEVLAMLLPDRRFVLWTTGAAVALVLLVVRRFLAQGGDPGPAEPGRNDPEESLRRWLSRTETLIRWSESTRSDWDRHRWPRARAWPSGAQRDPAPIGAGMTTPTGLPAATTTAHSEAVLDEIERVVVGKRSALTLILTTVLAGGHVLIEDLPGLGKTLIAKSFATALGLGFTRVQFTPDLLPADLLGSTVYDMRSGHFEFRPGPIFTNLLLADEINRTPPKTQAALLEAMAEGQVSIDGQTHRLPAPFIVLATDNPIEYEGTYPLPEAQLDRFAIRLELRYLSERDETSMLRRRLDRGSAEPTVNQVVDVHDLVAMRESVEQVTVQLARARALLLGRDYVIPEDVKTLAVPAMGHRISLRPEMWVRSVRAADVMAELLRRLPVPRARPVAGDAP
jgi:MoxR-like ATPase